MEELKEKGYFITEDGKKSCDVEDPDEV